MGKIKGSVTFNSSLYYLHDMKVQVYCIFTLVFTLILRIESHRTLEWPAPGAKYGNPWHVVDFNEHYYYHSIKDKMAESLSISNCTISGINDWPNYNAIPGMHADLEVKIILPDTDILTEWRNLQLSLHESEGHHATRRQFVRVDETLCSQKEFKYYSEGYFRRAKGCLKMMQMNRKTGKMSKVINPYGATLHPDHSRCYHLPAVKACATSTKVSFVFSEFFLFAY
jgi:hypothetical protein